MKKNLALLFILAIIIITLLFPSIIFKSFEASYYLFIFSVFPSLFLMMILTDIIINYRLADNILPIIEFITKPFKISGYSSVIWFLSIFAGSPGNAKMITTALNQNLIAIKEAEKLINITNFFNPLFIINTIGFNFFNNQLIGISLWTSMIIVNLLIASFYKKRTTSTIKLSFKPINLYQIVINAVKTLIIIFTLIFISTCLINLLNSFNINHQLLSIIEITNGMYYLGLNHDIKKIILAIILINNGSLSIILQNIMILQSTNINLKPYIIIKLVQILLFILACTY